MIQVEMLIDFQGILFLGLNLWTQAFLLNDNVNASLICYGLSLNCSTDGMLIGPFIIYSVCCKVLKDIYKSEGTFSKTGNQINNIYQDNDLDLGLLQKLAQELLNCLLAFLFGYVQPWLPYLWQLYNMYRVPLSINIFYDLVSHSLYNDNIINIHC